MHKYLALNEIKESFRPTLLTRHAGQNRLDLNLSHAQVDRIKEKLTKASEFLRRHFSRCGAVEFDRTPGGGFWAKIFEKYRDSRPLNGPVPTLASG